MLCREQTHQKTQQQSGWRELAHLPWSLCPCSQLATIRPKFRQDKQREPSDEEEQKHSSVLNHGIPVLGIALYRVVRPEVEYPIDLVAAEEVQNLGVRKAIAHSLKVSSRTMPLTLTATTG